MAEDELEPPSSAMDAEKQEREKRIEVLEKRLLLLEKDSAAEPATPFEEVLQLCWDLTRSVPLWSLLAFLTSSVALRGMLLYGHYLHSATTHLALGIRAQELAASVDLLCALVFFLSLFTLIVTFPATGAMRDYVFGGEHEDNSMICLQCLAGPCVLSMLLVFHAIIVVLLLVGLATTLPATSVFALASGSCEAGSHEDLSGVFADMLKTDVETMKTSMDGICSADYLEITNGNATFNLAVAVAFVGQVWQLVALMGTYVKVTALCSKTSPSQIESS